MTSRKLFVLTFLLGGVVVLGVLLAGLGSCCRGKNRCQSNKNGSN
jgi:hypothetical protein